MRSMSRSAPANLHPIRTLWWCALAIAMSFVVLSIARTHLSKEPERVFAIDSLRPSAQLDDSWWPMNDAFDYIRSPHTTPVYSKIFIERHVKFQYPLTSLLLMYVVRSRPTLSTISLILILMTCPLMISLFGRFLAAAAPQTPELKAKESWMERFGRFALPVLMTLTFYPVINAYRLGQLQTWLFAGFVLLVWLWTDGRTVAAGVIAGLLTCAKPQFALLFLWGATRKKWGFCWAFAITALFAFALSTALFGIHEQLDYLKVLSILSRHGESWWPNQCINGVLHRMLDKGVATQWEHYYVPPYSRTIYLATMFSSVVLIAGAFLIPVKYRGGVADLMLASLTFTVASPVAWTHHYSIMLPMFAGLFAWGVARQPLGRWTLPLLCLSYLLIGTFLGAFWKVAQTKLNMVQSYPFAGVIIALVVLYLWALRGEPGGATSLTVMKKATATSDAERSTVFSRPVTV